MAREPAGPGETGDELARLDAAIAAQEALRGTLPEEQLATILAALELARGRLLAARVKGSGAVAQGAGSAAAGAGGVAGNATGTFPAARLLPMLPV